MIIAANDSSLPEAHALDRHHVRSGHLLLCLLSAPMHVAD